MRSKPSLRPRTPRRGNVVAQVRNALRPESRIATLVGFLLGGFVPLSSYVFAHHEFEPLEGFWQVPLLLVAGGLVYSALTVYDWARIAFGHRVKAGAFVMLVEGAMIRSSTFWLSCAALGLLVAINGIQTGCNLSRKDG